MGGWYIGFASAENLLDVFGESGDCMDASMQLPIWERCSKLARGPQKNPARST